MSELQKRLRDAYKSLSLCQGLSVGYGTFKEAADALDAKDAEIARLRDDVSLAIGSNRYLDPPDGGNVPLPEQARRMRVECDALRARVEAAEKDAARYRWLTQDHDDPWVRQLCRELIERMGTMSYSATSMAIDAALEIDSARGGA